MTPEGTSVAGKTHSASEGSGRCLARGLAARCAADTQCTTVSQASTDGSRMRKALPPTYFLLALVVMALLHVLWPVRRYWGFPLNLLGLVPLALGAFLNVAADRRFKRHQTTVKPFDEPAALITSFPFSITRNPMYIGITLMLLGVAFLFGTVSALVPVPAFAVLMDLRFIRVEEAMLATRFGDQWEQYRVQVRRWL